MTIDALIAGKLHARPEARTSKNGKPFATAKMRAAAGDGDSLFVNVIAFEQAAVSALLALDAGDSIAIAYAGISGAFAGNVIPGQFDVLMLGITAPAAQLPRGDAAGRKNK